MGHPVLQKNALIGGKGTLKSPRKLINSHIRLSKYNHLYLELFGHMGQILTLTPPSSLSEPQVRLLPGGQAEAEAAQLRRARAALP